VAASVAPRGVPRADLSGDGAAADGGDCTAAAAAAVAAEKAPEAAEARTREELRRRELVVGRAAPKEATLAAHEERGGETCGREAWRSCSR